MTRIITVTDCPHRAASQPYLTVIPDPSTGQSRYVGGGDYQTALNVLQSLHCPEAGIVNRSDANLRYLRRGNDR